MLTKKMFFRMDEYVFWCTKGSAITFLGPDLPLIRLSYLLHERILLHRWIQSAHWSCLTRPARKIG